MSEFTSKGAESFPSLHFDEQRISEYATWTTERLEESVNEYGLFLSKPHMPRATKTAKRILEHLLFELGYRDGVYSEYTNKQEDELCGGRI